MRQIRDILRLHWEHRLTVRQIAQSAGVGLATVSGLLHRAEAAALGWPLPPELDDPALEGLLYPGAQGRPHTGRVEPDWATVDAELRRKGGHARAALDRVQARASRGPPLHVVLSALSAMAAAGPTRCCARPTGPERSCLSTTQARHCPFWICGPARFTNRHPLRRRARGQQLHLRRAPDFSGLHSPTDSTGAHCNGRVTEHRSRERRRHMTTDTQIIVDTTATRRRRRQSRLPTKSQPPVVSCATCRGRRCCGPESPCPFTYAGRDGPCLEFPLCAAPTTPMVWWPTAAWIPSQSVSVVGGSGPTEHAGSRNRPGKRWPTIHCLAAAWARMDRHGSASAIISWTGSRSAARSVNCALERPTVTPNLSVSTSRLPSGISHWYASLLRQCNIYTCRCCGQALPPPPSDKPVGSFTQLYVTR